MTGEADEDEEQLEQEDHLQEPDDESGDLVNPLGGCNKG